MKKFMKKIVSFVIMFTILMTSTNVIGIQVDTTSASTIKTISKSTKVVCNSNAKVKIPNSYKKCNFHSSNPKVATISKSGKLKAIRLGETTITVKSGSKSKKYKITVIPANDKDIFLKESCFLDGKSVSLKLASNKYDLSQIKPKYIETDDCNKFNSNGYCKKVSTKDSFYTFIVSYGLWEKELRIDIWTPDEILDELEYIDGNSLPEADITYSTKVFGESGLTELIQRGIQIYIDDKLVSDEITYTSGQHTILVKQGKNEYKRVINVPHKIGVILKTRDTTGVDSASKEVLEKLFDIKDKIIVPGMTDEEKVKAIHDYIIYNANYYYPKIDKSTAWAYGASGIVLHQAAVCQGYAAAFYFLAVLSGLDCYLVTGNTKGGPHAWNQVKVDGTWYYIDCTWDDPNDDTISNNDYVYFRYYLSEELWSDHTERFKYNFVEPKYNFEVARKYLTGSD